MQRSTGVLVAVMVFGGCEDDPTVEAEFAQSFQSGTIDGQISSRGGWNGSKDFGGSTALISKGAHENEALVRFAPSLPAGSVVTAATITLTFRDRDAGHNLAGHYVKNTWSESAIGWRTRDANASWELPGAKGPDTDIESAAAFVDTSWVGGGNVRKTYALDPATVQEWIDAPSTNLGIILFNNTQDRRELRLLTSEAAVPANRPMLTISYTAASTVAHPRIWIDATSLQALRQRAAAGDARWTRLRGQCDTYLPGIIRPPNLTKCQDSCSGSTICCGFQGELYYRAVLDLALCHQIGRGMSPPPANTNAWGQKGAAVLAQMATFTNYAADHGYGVRNFATGMSVGYDWLYDYLQANDPTTAANVVTSLNGWIGWYDAQPASFNFRQHPTSNYFAGYYAAKALTALATEGDNANSDPYWTQFLALHRTAVGTHAGIAPYYTRFLDGGGWVQGWQYGPLAVRNMIEPSLAAMTAKQVNLVTDPTAPFRYAVNNALHLMHFSTPSVTMMDDRDELASFNPADPGRCPSNAKVPTSTALTLTEMLRRWPITVSGDAVAPRFHSFTRAVRAIYPAAPWQDMLFWNDGAAEADYRAQPLRSYLATNYVAMRSDWSTNATLATMRAIAYSDKDNTHEHPDGGSLMITRGNGGPAGDWRTDVPFLVNPSFLMRCYGTLPILSAWQNSLRTDLLTSAGARSTTNGFRNSTTAGQSIVIYQDAAVPPQTRIRTFEDRGDFVFARAEELDDLYPATSGITEWARDLIFLRPGIVIVYDRTTSGGGDPHLSWHFAPTPVLAASPSPGATRYDVADAGVFKGAITTLIPANANVAGPENVFASNKLYGLQVRAGQTSGSIRWLTVLDTATSANAVAIATRIQTANANGALLTQAGSANRVVLFGVGAAGTPTSGPITYVQPAADTTVVVVDLQPNTAYAVTATAGGQVTIAPGASSFVTSSQGTLRVRIAANGSVSP